MLIKGSFYSVLIKANQIFWGFVTWGFKLGDKLGGLIIKK